jgi:hypothetical protein
MSPPKYLAILRGLIATLDTSDRIVPICKEASFRVDQSGMLGIAINDAERGGNGGAVLGTILRK